MGRQATQVIDRDLGYQAALSAVLGFENLTIEVGVMGTDYADGMPVGTVAIINEYGSDAANIPARPFMRRTWDNHRTEWERQMVAGMRRLLLEHILSRSRSRTVRGQRPFLNLLGAKMADQMRATLRAGPWAPNAPRTIARKGHAQPLVETGHLADSIDHLVRGAKRNGRAR